MVKAILFDFWGTLVENGVYPSPVRQVRNILRLRDIEFGEYITTFEDVFMTKTFDDLKQGFQVVSDAFKANAPEFVIEKLIGMWNKNMLLAKPYTETSEVIVGLKEKGIKVGLISNTDSFSVNQVLEKFNLPELFDHINLSCNTGMLKSNPKMFEVSLKALGVTKDEVIMVGDSIESDIKGAEDAGIKPVLIDRRERREYKNKIANLKEIDKFL